MQVSKETLEKSQIKLTIELSADELLPTLKKLGVEWLKPCLFLVLEKARLL